MNTASRANRLVAVRPPAKIRTTVAELLIALQDIYEDDHLVVSAATGILERNGHLEHNAD